MLDRNDPEDRQIFAILLTAACVTVVGLLTFAVIISVMISLNFNLLNWME